MIRQRFSTAQDFAKLTEETDRLAEHVAEVRRRMMEAALRKEQRNRMRFRVIVSEPANPSEEPVSRRAERQSSPPASSSGAPATKRPASGVYAVVRDITAGRYCFTAEHEPQGFEEVMDLPSLARRKVSA